MEKIIFEITELTTSNAGGPGGIVNVIIIGNQ